MSCDIGEAMQGLENEGPPHYSDDNNKDQITPVDKCVLKLMSFVSQIIVHFGKIPIRKLTRQEIEPVSANKESAR